MRTLPEARIHIDTLYYRVEALAACKENPFFNLILGIIEGARAPAELDGAWRNPYNTKKPQPWTLIDGGDNSRWQGGPLWPWEERGDYRDVAHSDKLNAVQAT
ncbi:hypothetical protein HPB52_001698 [Rhipicephalus sanguineus]|uniref:Uncharacterized protein n=1 Tax=Rhipicephalus sanguineus TaxID=34632 RepID=A0A9D4PCF9_RHISA|nr:hypothetical protein HPB52_001698 [Rhipicephalus sanguineus]